MVCQARIKIWLICIFNMASKKANYAPISIISCLQYSVFTVQVSNFHIYLCLKSQSWFICILKMATKITEWCSTQYIFPSTGHWFLWRGRKSSYASLVWVSKKMQFPSEAEGGRPRREGASNFWSECCRMYTFLYFKSYIELFKNRSPVILDIYLHGTIVKGHIIILYMYTVYIL